LCKVSYPGDRTSDANWALLSILYHLYDSGNSGSSPLLLFPRIFIVSFEKFVNKYLSSVHMIKFCQMQWSC
jgi:hypothetical protein